jgi:hypothetical protein
MRRKPKPEPWPAAVCDFMSSLCDIMELPDCDRLKWAADARAQIAAAERERKRPRLVLIAGNR